MAFILHSFPAYLCLPDSTSFRNLVFDIGPGMDSLQRPSLRPRAARSEGLNAWPRLGGPFHFCHVGWLLFRWGGSFQEFASLLRTEKVSQEFACLLLTPPPDRKRRTGQRDSFPNFGQPWCDNIEDETRCPAASLCAFLMLCFCSLGRSWHLWSSVHKGCRLCLRVRQCVEV